MNTNNCSSNQHSKWRPVPWPLRTISWLLAVLQVIQPMWPQFLRAQESLPVEMAKSASPAPSADPEVIVNRTLPEVSPAPVEQVFSETPTDAEISRSRVFGLALVPIGATSAQENRALALALGSFRTRTESDDPGALTQFLNDHPDSAWKASLLLNLGILYRHTGWFTKALAAWEESWELAKNGTDLKSKDVADTSVSELLELNSRLGRFDRLETLFSELNGRAMNAALVPKLTSAKEGLWLMRNRPEDAFRCGPMALSQIGPPAKTSEGEFYEKIHQSRSTLEGMSLKSVCELANQLGMNYQMALRVSGSEVLLPAVIHWKAGHYAALVAKNGDKYLVKDPTFGDQILISASALDQEATGYCLVRAGELPAGWKTVSEKDGGAIYGKGATGANDPGQTQPNNPKVPPCFTQGTTPMAEYAVHTMLVSLNIVDTPVGYIPARGPDMHFQVTYNQKEAYPPSAIPPSNIGYANLGAQWTFNWMAYIVDDPQTPANPAYYFVQGGGYETYMNFNSTNQSYAVQADSHATLIRTATNSYERDLPDGSKQIFARSDGSASYPRRIFMTQIKDPSGNAASLTYNSTTNGLQLVAIKDAIGQVMTITNELTNDTLKITKVTDPFGRSAQFQYNNAGQLTNITDIIGITSSFTYDTNGSVVSLRTPYGTSTFAYGQNGRDSWLEATDAMGAKERVEYDDQTNAMSDTAPVVPAGLGLVNNYLSYRNTFYWDKQAMQLYPGDYSKARIFHWLHSDDYNTCTGVEESTKEPLEERVWKTYAGQPDSVRLGTNSKPAVVARVLDDGTSQLYQYQYNPIGLPTQVTDPSNRVTKFVYATNNIDLLKVYQMVGTNSSNTLRQFTYNSSHLPLTAVDAAGQTNIFSYNTNGQLTGMTNALKHTLQLNYSTNGYLTNLIAGWFSNTTWRALSTNSFAYDGYGRVLTVKDPLGYTFTNLYDAADRVTNITYLDGTYERIVYNYLDAVLLRGRDGHWTAQQYDALRHLTDTYDNLGRHTHFDWCNCGALAGITDPLGNATTWVRDAQERVIGKVYPDFTQINYGFETNGGRLLSVTDAKGQTTKYQYYIDNNLKQVSYTNATVATPAVSFTYDTNYNRAVTMTDGTGTTTYRYYNMTNGQLGAGMLSSASNSFIGASSLISYTYDAAGRVTNRAINGVSQTVTFDALDRVSALTNALGAFSNVFVGPTRLVSTNFGPNGRKSVFSYLSITNDERLSEIWNQKTNGATLSKFDYSYDPVGQITNWTQQVDTNSPTAYSYSYDPGNEVLSAVLKSTGVGTTVLKQYAYGYDLAGNRTGEQIGTTTNAPAALSQSSYNNVNQLTNRSVSGGPLQFAGSLDKQGTVSIAGNPATMNHLTTNFVGYAGVTNGTNVIAITATDYGSHSRTNRYQLVVTNNGVAETLRYDLNGNLTNMATATYTNTFEWDVVNRLTAINEGATNRSEFMYDGMGRRVQIVEKTNGVAYVTNKFIWDGTTLAEQRNNTLTNVARRFFEQGEQISGTNYFFTRDHLGSVREMTDSAGTIRARYDYDPYGRRTKLSGDADADFGFTGYYYHSNSGLYLTLFREYDPTVGKWISRDPVAESTGINLYAYVFNNPVNAIDPLGLWSWAGAFAIVAGVAITAAAIIAAPEIIAAVAVSAVVGGVLGAATAEEGHGLQGFVAGFVAGAAGAATGGLLAGAGVAGAAFLGGAAGSVVGDIANRDTADGWTAASGLLGGILGQGLDFLPGDAPDWWGGLGAAFGTQVGQTVYIDLPNAMNKAIHRIPCESDF